MADWREELGGFFQKAEADKQDKEMSEFARFVLEVVEPAFRDIAVELEKHGRTVTIRTSITSAAIIVLFKGEEEMTYRIQERTFPDRVLPYAGIRSRERKGLKFVRVESMVRSGPPEYALDEITGEEIIRHFLDHYMRRVRIE
jgi:choline/glycine/proline betaine transport protein